MTPPPPKGKTYWRSLNELADKPGFREFVEREFPAQASEFTGGGAGRRTFLKIMGASVALAGLASCRRWPEEKLAPYAHRPAGRMDGVPVHYATAYEVGGMGYGVVATSFDGRPIKVDGNPGHPLTRGASDMFMQASVLNVYDPDRSRGVVRREWGKQTEATWEEFEAVAKGIDKGKLVVLSEASRSPSVARLRGELIKAGAKWFEYEAVSGDNQREATRQVFGKPLRAVPRLDEAAVIVSIDADFFGPGEPLAIKYSRDFAAGRRLHESDAAKIKNAAMNRLYVVETGFSITGSMADHRRGVKPSEVAMVLELIQSRLATKRAEMQVTLEYQSLQAFAEAVAKDIKALKPTDVIDPAQPQKAVFIAGSRQPAQVHTLVAVLNAEINAPVDYYDDGDDWLKSVFRTTDVDWKPHGEQLKMFVEAAGGAGAVLVLGANPVLTAPGDVNVREALRKAKLSIHAGMYEDETARACQWHVPMAHFLEAWGDVRTFDGTVSVAQPLIEPIFGGKSVIEILAIMLDGAGGAGAANAPARGPGLNGVVRSGYDIVRETARNEYLSGSFSEWAWKKALHDGVVAGTAAPTVPLVRSIILDFHMGDRTMGLELALYAGAAHDGRYANNGWLMELPDPMTRVSWENPLIMSPKTAIKLGVASDEVVRVKTAACKEGIEAVVYVLPGQPEETLSLAVGYGRAGLGSVADGTGANAYALRSSTSMVLDDVTVEKTGKTRQVACVQDHHVVDTVGKNRLNTIVPELVVEGTLEEYKKNPGLGVRKIAALSIFNEHKYDKGEPGVMARWGMAIDLTACTGCSACVVACQAENNIPIVGQQMVYRGREMQWLRIDRYFKFPKTGAETWDTEGVPEVVHQPVLCQHCENAPCEEVCPVAATTHSHEGLNMMTYNRCIGTRYCSNNCPYKVRRFNFFDYNSGATVGAKANLYTPNLLRAELDELAKMQKNPQVTVRSRGVMEKCTFCVQRIEKARIELRAGNRQLAENAAFEDGSVMTACAQACPAGAIVFGDLNDKNSRVAKMQEQARSYGLLDAELNTKPRLRYLAKIRNHEDTKFTKTHEE